jgi:putative ABC transport system substrate-binding protein
MNATRRRFLAGFGATVILPRTVGAQPGRKVARVGWVGGGADRLSVYLEAFREGLRQLGWVEGQNLLIEVRTGTRDQARDLAAELVQAKVDVLVTQGPMLHGARAAAGSTPIVFGFSGDPVEAKLVASLARPGGTVTGMTFLGIELAGKRVAILKEAAPSVVRLAILASPHHAGEKAELTVSQDVARRLGLTIQYLPVPTADDFGPAFEAITRERAEAIMAFPDALIMSQARAIADHAIRRRIPSVSGWDEFAAAGNVMSYGPHLRESWRQIAGYVDKILRGAKPADLPIELPSKLQLVINAKTARAIGLTIPPSVLLRADRIIE